MAVNSIAAFWKRWGGRFARDTSGNLAVVFALTLIPLLTGVGAAVDYSNANGVRTGLQAALDAAVLAGAGDTTSNRKSTATNSFNANFVPTAGVTAGQPSFVDNDDGTLSGIATASASTAFMGLIGIKTIPVTAKATAAVAAVGTAGKAMCIISLNATVQEGIGASGSASVNAPDCTVQVNSNHSTAAVDMSGSTMIKSAENCFVGKLKTYSSLSVSPPADAVCKPLNDPFATMAKPTVGACYRTNYSAAQGEILQPGVYCGGLTISSKTVSFAPGLYVIKDGDLNASGSSRLTGTGVSFFRLFVEKGGRKQGHDLNLSQ
jgi:Flp pilus assembly protein TadG